MAALFSGSGLSPHGFCLLWEPALIWLQAASDVLIGLAYYSIPIALVTAVRKRKRTSSLALLFMLFSAFILACGTTHFMSVLTLWLPAYWTEGYIKLLTATLSVATALLIWPIMDAVERSELRYQLLADNATDLILKATRDFDIVYASPSAGELLGYFAGQIERLPRLILFHPDDHAIVNDALRSVNDIGGRYTFTCRVYHQNGRWIWFEFGLRSISNARANMVGVMAIGRDVTDRIAADRQIRDSEARYRMLAETMSDAISCLDPMLIRTYASPSYVRLTGFGPEEMVGGSPRDIIHPEDWPAAFAVFSDLIGANKQVGLQYRLRTKSNEWIWVETEARSLPNRSGLILSVRDITRRKEVEQELAAATAKLEDLVRVDSLTGLANRRQFDVAIESEFRRCARYQLPMSLIFIDVDQFKTYNDHYGHQAGDACLQAIAKVVRALARRPTDVAARYGGEELAVILPDTEGDNAAAIAAQMRVTIRNLNIPHAGSTEGYVTASFGVSMITPWLNKDSWTDLVFRADKLLYLAKAQGRNRVISEAQNCELLELASVMGEDQQDA